MRVPRIVPLGVLLLPLRIAVADVRHHTDEPAKNLKKLRINAAEDRKAGNRAAAWAAEEDARRVEKQIKKDQK